MYQDKLFPWRGVVLGTLLLAGWLPAAAAADDPVEALRQAIRQDRDSAGTADLLKFRRENLTRCADRITNLADLGRALLLREWHYENQDAAIVRVEQEVLSVIGKRCLKETKAALQSDDPARAQAAATLIAEMVATAREAGLRGQEVEYGLASLSAPLIKLTQSPDQSLGTAAIRALGRLGPDAKGVLKALEHTLQTGGVPQRQAAASALVSLLEDSSQAVKMGGRKGGEVGVPNPRNVPGPGTPPGPPDGFRGEAVAVAVEVVPVAGRALADQDAAVRRRGAEAIRQAALALQDVIVLPAGVEFPPPGRKLTTEEHQQIADYRAEVERERKELAPLARVLAQQIPALDRVVADADLKASLTANRALERLADARRALLQRAASVPTLPGKEAGERHPEDPLGEALKEAVPVLAKQLSADEVRARLASLYVLESLGTEAAAAAGEVVKALRDKDPFVRWGAARVLGKTVLKGEAADKAVAGLAPLLKDDNADVRLGAATALRSYGAAARGAVPQLSAAAREGDEEVRFLAIATLQEVGPEAGKEAVAALEAALNADEPEVRTAAAGALGRVAPGEKSAREALRKALDDPDEEVRRAASRAILQGKSGRP